MKRSSKVTLTIVAVMGLAGCSRRRDPCEAQYFDDFACQEAVRSGGYYWGGTWYPMTYHNPYPYYYDSYRSHVAKGGKVFGSRPGSYAKPTTRSGFGSTGSRSVGS